MVSPGWAGAQVFGSCTLVPWSCIATSATLRGVGPGMPVQSMTALTTTPPTLQQPGVAPKLYDRSCCFARQRRAEMLGSGSRRQLSSWTVLGLDPREADAAAVKKAYFEAAKNCHPDLHGATATNVQRFQELSLAVDDILRKILRDGGGGISCTKDGAGATTAGASSSTAVSRDDPEFASSFFEFINREMSDTTRAEIKAAVEMGGGGLDRGGWWAAAQQMAHDIDAADDTTVEQRQLASPGGGAGSRQAARESAATGWKRSRRRRRR